MTWATSSSRGRIQDIAFGNVIRLGARSAGWLALGGCVLLWLVYLYVFLPYTVDDAAIYWRVGEHISSVGRYAYNVAGDPYDPSSGTLWVLLAAVFARLHLEPLAASKVAGLGCTLLFAWRAWRVAQVETTFHPQWAVLPAMLVLVSPYGVIHAVSGLETPLFTWLLFETIVASSRSGHGLYLAVTATLLGLTRWEGFAFAATAVCARGSFGGGTRRHDWLVAGSTLCLVTLALVVWRTWYFGDPLPLSFYFKAVDLTDTSRAHKFFWFFFERIEWLAAIGIVLVAMRSTTARQLLFNLVWVGAVIAVLALYSQGSLEMNFADRFAFQICLPVLVFLATRVEWARLRHGWVLALAVTLLWYPHHQPQRREMKELAQETGHLQFLTAVGSVMRPAQSCGFTVALAIAGTVPYRSGWEVLDYHGLADPLVAKRRHDAGKVLQDAIEGERVDILVTSVQADTDPMIAKVLRGVREDTSWGELGMAEGTRFFVRQKGIVLAGVERRLKSVLAAAEHQNDARQGWLASMHPCGDYRPYCDEASRQAAPACEDERAYQLVR